MVKSGMVVVVSDGSDGAGIEPKNQSSIGYSNTSQTGGGGIDITNVTDRQ